MRISAKTDFADLVRPACISAYPFSSSAFICASDNALMSTGRADNEVGSLSDLKHQITVKTEAGKSAKQSVVKLEHRMKDLAEIIKYAKQYKTNRSYHIAYKKSKNPDAYFRRYESQLILYGGARRVLEQTGINLKGLNVDKLKAEYQELMKQKNELTSTYKDCEKEVRELKRKQENLNQYLGRTQPNPAQEQPEKNKNKSL